MGQRTQYLLKTPFLDGIQEAAAVLPIILEHVLGLIELILLIDLIFWCVVLVLVLVNDHSACLITSFDIDITVCQVAVKPKVPVSKFSTSARSEEALVMPSMTATSPPADTSRVSCWSRDSAVLPSRYAKPRDALATGRSPTAKRDFNRILTSKLDK